MNVNEINIDSSCLDITHTHTKVISVTFAKYALSKKGTRKNCHIKGAKGITISVREDMVMYVTFENVQ